MSSENYVDWFQQKYDLFESNLDDADDMLQVGNDIHNNIERVAVMLDNNTNDGIIENYDAYVDLRTSFEDDLEELEYLIKSSRGLLSRFDEQTNAMRFTPDQAIKLYDPPPYDGHHQFEFEFDLKLEEANSNILYAGEEDTYLTVESIDYQIHAAYVDRTDGPSKSVRINTEELQAGVWYRIKVSSSGLFFKLMLT